MKKMNAGMMITATLVWMYMALSRMWAIGYLLIKNIKPLASSKTFPAAKTATSETASA